MNIHSKARLDQILWEHDATKSQRDAAYLAYARGKEDTIQDILKIEQGQFGDPIYTPTKEELEGLAEEIIQPDGATPEEVHGEWLDHLGDLPGDEWKH